MPDPVVTPPSPAPLPAPAPQPVPAPVSAPGNLPWYGTVDAETMGYLQTRGLDRMTPDKAALEAIKAHRAAEAQLGAPADQLVRIPPVGDVKAWNEVYQKLGMPADKKDYDFSVFKKPDGTPMLDESQQEVIRDLSHSLNLSKDRAVLLVQKLAAITENEAKQEDATGAAEHAKQLDTLKNNWSHNALANKVTAENAARALGLDPAAFNTNGAPVTIPYAQALEMFRQIGTKIGEDRFITNGNSGAPQAMSKEQAQYRLDQLSHDTVWYDKFQKGDTVAAKEFNDLTRLVAGI